MKRSINVVACLLFVTTLFFPALCFAGWDSYRWPIFRGDRGLTGVARGNLPDDMRLLWKFKTDDAIISSPVVDKDTVYIGSTDGKVYALRLKNGKKIWEVDTGTAVEAPPLILNSMIYVGSLDGLFYAIDSRDGTVRWTYETAFRIAGSANWVSSVSGKGYWILIGSYDSTLHCVDAQTGKRVWYYETISSTVHPQSTFSKNGRSYSAAAMSTCMSFLSKKDLCLQRYMQGRTSLLQPLFTKGSPTSDITGTG